MKDTSHSNKLGDNQGKKVCQLRITYIAQPQLPNFIEYLETCPAILYNFKCRYTADIRDTLNWYTVCEYIHQQPTAYDGAYVQMVILQRRCNKMIVLFKFAKLLRFLLPVISLISSTSSVKTLIHTVYNMNTLVPYFKK